MRPCGRRVWCDMLGLRPYKSCDAETVVSWIDSQKALRQWSADRFAEYQYPLTPAQYDGYYRRFDAVPNIFPMTAFDQRGTPAGHLLLRWPEEDRRSVRLGFIILDPACRGRGMGRELVNLAAGYAFGFLRAERLTLGVFDNNPAARRCYEAAGFRAVGEKPCLIDGELWPCTEMELLWTEKERECQWMRK